MVASLVFAILVIVSLSARLIYIQRKLTLKAAKSEGSDVSDAGKLMRICNVKAFSNLFLLLLLLRRLVTVVTVIVIVTVVGFIFNL